MIQQLNEFTEGTKNAAIFKTTAPYANPYQGAAPRWLFVCSAGLLRSPTGAATAIKHGINARAAGSNPHYALIPLSANLINWAQKIVFVNDENYQQALKLFEGHGDLHYQLTTKAHVLNIPDVFEYGETQLVNEFERELFS
jgi:predicted protein tyrosine phosphatase